MANFFNNVIAPQLNSTEYGQGIQDMVNTINDNFQKVFTLPFLKGDDGDMISTEFCPFWEKVYNSNDEIEVDKCLLTQEGAKIYNTIFETDKFSYSEENRMTYNNFKKVLIDDLKLYSNNNSYNNISLYTDLYGPHKDPKILLFYKISSEDGVSETPLGSSQLYYYFDPRINKLSELITINNNDNNAKNYRQDFRDYTCILSTKYDSDGNYTYEKQSGWPTLYFDNSSKQYCWSINGQQTGVNAQGVNGKDGIGARIWVCQVELLDKSTGTQMDYENDSMSQFKITKVFVPKDSKWEEPGDTLKQHLGETNYFQQGDMAVCYLPNSENNGIYQDQLIGVINQKSNDNKEFFIQASISQNTTNTFKNLSLFNLLNNIGKEGNPKMKGIFIPTHEDNKIHALYEGKFDGQKSGLYLVKTDTNNINGDTIVLDNQDTKFNIHYNTDIYGQLTVNNTTTLNSGLRTNEIKTIDEGDLIIQTLATSKTIYIGGSKQNNSGNIQLSKKTSSCNIKPIESDKYSLGTSSNQWSNVWATIFNGKLKGTIVLDKQTKDENYPMVFASGIGDNTTGRSLYTDETGFAYKPSSNTLTVGQLNVTSGTPSNATNSGTIIVNGGVGISGAMNIGGNANITGTLNVTSTTTLGGGATVHGNITTDAIELSSSDPYIDFKADYTTLDYSSRIISWKDTPSNLDIISPYGEVRLNPFNFMINSGKKTTHINNCTTIQANHTGEELDEKDGDSLKGYWPFLRVQFGGTGKSMLLVVKPQKDNGDFKVRNLIDIKGYVVDDSTIQPSNTTVSENSDRDKNQSSSTEVNVWKPDTEIFDNNWFINNGFTVDGTVTKPDWILGVK